MPGRRRYLHLVFWLGGLLAAALPYLAAALHPDWRVPWMLPPGHFADNLVIAARNILLCATLGGWLGLLLTRQESLQNFRQWWRKPRALNWIWFALTILIYSTQNILILNHLPLDGPSHLSAAAGRVFTVITLSCALWFVTIAAASAAPPSCKKVPWFIAALFPAIIAVDAFALIVWKTPIRLTLNRLDEQGAVNLARELAAGGLEQSPAQFLLGVLAFVLIVLGLFHLSGRLSAKLPWRPAALSFLFLGLGSWLILCAEKGGGFLWKSRQALRWEHSRYEVHLSPFTPPEGVSRYAVTFTQASPALPAHQLSERPDIFLIFLESVRSRSFNEDTAPFLTTEFARDCQQLGRTWASSNATHLSWFSAFHGSYPFEWKAASDQLRKSEKAPPSPWFQALDELGYRREARAVCDLSYLGMGPLNFGTPYELDALSQAPEGSPLAALSIPEREVEILNQARQSLLSAPSSGNFHLIALDAPHFPYEWHPDFDPPFTEFDPEPLFHAYPNAEDIQRVKNRYWNAIAWSDHQLSEFIAFLKAQNRYENALIIVTADHGEEFQEHGSWFHCSSLEPEQTEVPLLIKWPAGTPAPAHRSASHLDLLPSLLDFLGYPESSFAQLPGRSLLRASPTEEATQVTLTTYCGVQGVAMAWQRGAYRATFRWDEPWRMRAPETIILDDITGPDGSLDFDDPAAWQEALARHFPDAPERFFTRFEPLPGDSP